MRRLTAYVGGKVQKTGFRARVVTIANNFGLKGYVQNLPDGKVKIVAEGDDSDLERFLKALNIKNTMIEVREIQKEFSSTNGEFQGFEKMVSDGETDQRLDQAFELFKELIDINRDMLKETKEMHGEIRDMHGEIKGMREELKVTHDDLVKEIRSSRDDIVTEIKATREDIVSEIRSSRDDIVTEIKATREDIVSEIRSSHDETLTELELRSADDKLGKPIDCIRDSKRDTFS